MALSTWPLTSYVTQHAWDAHYDRGRGHLDGRRAQPDRRRPAQRGDRAPRQPRDAPRPRPRARAVLPRPRGPAPRPAGPVEAQLPLDAQPRLAPGGAVLGRDAGGQPGLPGVRLMCRLDDRPA